MKNHELVPAPLVDSIAGLRHGALRTAHPTLLCPRLTTPPSCLQAARSSRCECCSSTSWCTTRTPNTTATGSRPWYVLCRRQHSTPPGGDGHGRLDSGEGAHDTRTRCCSCLFVLLHTQRRPRVAIASAPDSCEPPPRPWRPLAGLRLPGHPRDGVPGRHCRGGPQDWRGQGERRLRGAHVDTCTRVSTRFASTGP